MHDSLFHQDAPVQHDDLYDDPYPDFLTWSPDTKKFTNTPRSSPYVIQQRNYQTIHSPLPAHLLHSDLDANWAHRGSFSSYSSASDASVSGSVPPPRIKLEEGFYPDHHRLSYDLQLLQAQGSPTGAPFSPTRSAFYSPPFQQQQLQQQQLQHHHQQLQQQHHHQQQTNASFASYRLPTGPNATMHPADLAPDAVSPLSYHPQAWHPPQDPFDLDHDQHINMATLDVGVDLGVGEMMDMDGMVVVSGGMPVGLGDDSIPMGNPGVDVGSVPEETGEEDADGEDDWEAHSYQQQQQHHQQLQHQHHQHQISAYSDAFQHSGQSMDVQQAEEVAEMDIVRIKSDDDHATHPRWPNSSRAPRGRSDQHNERPDSDGEGEERGGESQEASLGANGHSHSTRNGTRTVKSPLSTSSISNASDEDHKPEAEDEESAASDEEEEEEEDPDESPSSDDDYDDDNDPEFVLTTRSSRARRGASATPAGLGDASSYPGGPASYPTSGAFAEGRSLRPRAASARVRYNPYPGSASSAGAYSEFYDAQGYIVDGTSLAPSRGRYASTASGSISPPLDGNAAGRTRGVSAGQATPHAQSRAHSTGAHSASSASRGGVRAPVSVPIPVPVPNLTKKSRGRRVPTMESLEDLRSAASGAGRKRQGPAGKGARMYLCEVEGCGKCFARGEHLKRHVRSIHTYEKREWSFLRRAVCLTDALCSSQVHVPWLWQGL